MGHGATNRKNQGLTWPGSGYVNVQSMTGVPVWRLEIEALAFARYDFDMDATRAPWIPEADWNRITEASFPGCTEFSLKTMANSAGYSNWRSFERAVTSVGSAYHFMQDGPLWATAANSYMAGPAQLRAVMIDRRRAGHCYQFTGGYRIK